MLVSIDDGRPRFDRYSESNAATVQASMPCGCRPYVDVFTFHIWRRMGFMVRKGEHGLHLDVLAERTIEDKDTGENRRRRVHGHTTVFCRHQVEAL